MYECSTKSEAEKHGCGGLARITFAVRETKGIRCYPPRPPNSRSIPGLQKNRTNAETGADVHAVVCAEFRAETYAELRAVSRADGGAEKLALLPIVLPILALMSAQNQG